MFCLTYNHLLDAILDDAVSCKEAFLVHVNFVWQPVNSLLEFHDSSERLRSECANNPSLDVVVCANNLILSMFVRMLAIASCKSMSSKQLTLRWKQVSSNSFFLQIQEVHCHDYWDPRRFLLFSEFSQNYFLFLFKDPYIISSSILSNLFYWLLPSTPDPLCTPCVVSEGICKGCFKTKKNMMSLKNWTPICSLLFLISKHFNWYKLWVSSAFSVKVILPSEEAEMVINTGLLSVCMQCDPLGNRRRQI